VVPDVARAFVLLTAPERVSTLCRFDDRKGDLLDEANVSTQSTPASQDARVSRAHEDEGRTKGVEAPSGEGPQTADRLSGGLSRRQRLTTSAEFQALFQRGKRIDRPALIVLWRESNDPTRVGFAVSRQVRLAVQRNRARRRLREAYRAARDAAPDRAALVVIARPAVLREPFAALLGQMRQALGAIPRPRRA
jgi:ribonuclease P protein component